MKKITIIITNSIGVSWTNLAETLWRLCTILVCFGWAVCSRCSMSGTWLFESIGIVVVVVVVFVVVLLFFFCCLGGGNLLLFMMMMVVVSLGTRLFESIVVVVVVVVGIIVFVGITVFVFIVVVIVFVILY